MGRRDTAQDPEPSPGAAARTTGGRSPAPARTRTGPHSPTIKQHLAAIRRLFDWLVTGQVMPTNPATSVRGPTHVVRTGKTPVLQPAEARQLLDTIDTSTVRGLRDRALLAVMVYSFARVSAVVGMRVEDYYQQGKARTPDGCRRAGDAAATPAERRSAR